MELTEEALESDEERFQKNLLADQNTFQDRLDSLNMAVAGFAAHTDISKAHEIANDTRRLVKQMKECQQLAQTYNNRERLFNLPVTSVRHVYVYLIDDFSLNVDVVTYLPEIAVKEKKSKAKEKRNKKRKQNTDVITSHDNC